MNTLNSQYINPFEHDGRGKKWTQEKIKEVIETFEIHKTVKRVAIILDKSEDTIKKILNFNGISTPTRNQYRAQQWSFYEELQKLETQLKIVELYSSGLSANEIGKQYKTSHSVIRKIIKRHKAQRNLPKHVFKLEENKDQILLLFRQGIKFVDIAKQFKCSCLAIRNFISKHTHYKTRKKAKHPIPIEDIEKIYKLHHEELMTLKQIGELYGCTSPCVGSFFDKHNIPRRTKKQALELIRHDENILHKRVNNLKKRKPVILPSGKIINVMGYEDSFLNFVFNNKLLKEEDIVFDVKSIPYTENHTNRKYIPDFYIPKLNLIIEIKSLYIVKLQGGVHNLLCKRKGVLAAGYNFCLVLENNFETFLKYLTIES